jgi:HAE1 family hydrophobic/amphiphilic exporter-1
LWFAFGAGASARRILGTVVIVGMLAATAIAIFIIPVTFYLVEKITMRFSRKHPIETSVIGQQPLVGD